MSPFLRFFFKRSILFTISVALVLLLGFCSNERKSASQRPLTADELYLIEAYVSVNSARILHQKDPLKAESLFTRLDSTLDTLRISNTIRALNVQPDRWAIILQEIEKALRESPYRGNLEETR
ncbi:MAG: hypothetical protein GTO51_01685 [Candidatus Latescibacteria bacterium]|nr:hypothetical protein [Candidatus Latescibacterota bacterium]NIM22138.1 hypothetical protein [Candidatus Latescibacterota bacterium]NIM64688.1 hypothetical protein [Candidatus Latescibacterota bacterium]NIO01198.1 hypothetical protein [Candidatus Latescibacterota bacterium]NIO27583.1 hypothetical protein [Candidatus Latescibacterota bacterium]